MTTVAGTSVRRSTAATRTSVLQRPLASYYLVLVSTGLLLAIGFVMVLSASSVRAYATYGNSYAIALKQGIFIGVGLLALFVAARVPAPVWRKLGAPLLLVSIALLVVVLIPGVGRNVDGATRWIALPGGFNLQPSELAKLGVALWGADLLVRKRKLLGDWKHLLIPLVPVTGLVTVLVMLEPDMGTTIVVTSILMSLLWVVGAPGRVFGGLLVGALSLGLVMAVAEPYRLARIVGFLDPCAAHMRLDRGFQACQGLMALDAGGWFGLGLGAGREKWAGGLPNPYTDYVFAIVGEELGLLGTLTVLLLFTILTYAGVRIAKRTTDPFSRLAASAITIWIAVQALVNIGTVVGLVPITGIPLPLISFGGSALISTLLSVGMLLSFARNEPGAQQALAARHGRVRTLLTRRSPAPTSVPRQRSRSSAPARRPVSRKR
ncbi:MAG: cell division protein FtsW [Frankiales bacterium]|nr:cell division protein FtsW [Frankiales bacterium]